MRPPSLLGLCAALLAALLVAPAGSASSAGAGGCRSKCVHILAVGRSGSTTLQDVLNALPGYGVRGENGGTFIDLWRLHKRFAAEFEGMRKRRSGGGGGAHTPRPPPWLDAVTADALHASLRDVWPAFFYNASSPTSWPDVCGIKEVRYVWGPGYFDKEADLYDAIDFLRSMCDQSLVIFQTRAANATCKSSWWGTDHMRDKCFVVMEQTLAAYATYHSRHPDTTFLSTFEGLLQGSTLVAILRFLGLQHVADDGAKLAALQGRFPRYQCGKSHIPNC